MQNYGEWIKRSETRQNCSIRRWLIATVDVFIGIVYHTLQLINHDCNERNFSKSRLLVLFTVFAAKRFLFLLLILKNMTNKQRIAQNANEMQNFRGFRRFMMF